MDTDKIYHKQTYSRLANKHYYGIPEFAPLLMSVIKEYVMVAEHNYDTTFLLEQVSHI